MKIDDLFEHWGIDGDSIADAVFDARPKRELVVVGGSLADELGSTRSDVDVHVITDALDTWPLRPITSSLLVGEFTSKGVAIHVHVVAERDVHVAGHDLLRLLADSSVIRRLGDYSRQQIALLHALRAGIAIAGRDVLPRIQTDSACDLLPLMLALRALLSFNAFESDRDELLARGDTWGATAASRLRAEAAVDALLATLDYANPNPKWRIPLLRRAVRHGRWPFDLDDTVRALFPRHEGESSSTSSSLPDQCVAEALRHPLVASYADDLRAGDTDASGRAQLTEAVAS